MKIFQLARLLLKERWRKVCKSQGQSAWILQLSGGLTLLFFAWIFAAFLTRLLNDVSPQQIGIGLNSLLATWVVVGVLTGHDFTWRVQLERLIFFPLSFQRLYGLTLILGFFSYPLLLGLSILEVSFWRKNPHWAGGLTTLLSFCLLVCIVRLIVSLIRTGLFQGNALTKPVRYLWLGTLMSAVMLVTVSMFHHSAAMLLPGSQFGFILLGIDPLKHLLFMATTVLILLCLDYVVQYNFVYSGIKGPRAWKLFRKPAGRVLLLHSSASSTLWRISMLGWLRNRNVLLSLILGGGYFFTFIYFYQPDEQIDFILCCWGVILFHMFLRGNLFGVDRAGVWLYFMLPIPIENTLRAKNSALNYIQMLMVAAVLLPAVLGRTSVMTTSIEWIGVLSFACTGILLGEIFGSIFSVLYPEPIDRFSRTSGGTTPGALLVPLIQTLILAILLLLAVLARHFLPTFLTAVLMISVPIILWITRSTVLRLWVRKRMIKEQETILFKLM